MNTLLKEMLSHADPSQVAGLARFFKTGPGQYGEGDKFLGIRVPVTREVVKSCWRELETPGIGRDAYCSEKSNFPQLEECIASEYHEVRLAALLALVEIFKHAHSSRPATTGHLLQQRCVDFYLTHTGRINNWDLVDLSCYPLLGEWLMDKDRSLLYDLARNGRTIWEQRIGIVSTMTFVRHGQLDDTFAIADILLHHPHDLIHKAVGWLLREAGKKDKNALEVYLQGVGPESCSGRIPAGAPGSDSLGVMPGSNRAPLPRYKTMPRTALRYAIEKFPEPERQKYLAK